MISDPLEYPHKSGFSYAHVRVARSRIGDFADRKHDDPAVGPIFVSFECPSIKWRLKKERSQRMASHQCQRTSRSAFNHRISQRLIIFQ